MILDEVHAGRPVQVGFTYGPNHDGHVVLVIGLRSGSGCPLCGFRGGHRDDAGQCVDGGTCAHRRMLELKGRPRQSGCHCAGWPCPCKCHGDEHDPFDCTGKGLP